MRLADPLRKRAAMLAAVGRIVVTGSVAFDTIMEFAGRFADLILPGREDFINVSFLVERLERRRGGTAANIAYTLALLGERPLLAAGVGYDFDDYGRALQEAGVDTSATLRCDDVPTASGFITTDADANQITAFFPGAMARAAGVDVSRHEDVSAVVIGADDAEAIAAHVEQAAAMGARLVFTPAQQIPALPDEVLRAGLQAAWIVAGNAYELELIRSRTGMSIEELRAGRLLAVTRGRAGSELHSEAGVVKVPVAPPVEVIDPTGAGDAYVAGLLAGLRRGLPLESAGRMAALAATYVVEGTGPQTHGYSVEEFAARYAGTYGERIELAPGSPVS